MPRKLTQSEFIERAVKVHGNKQRCGSEDKQLHCHHIDPVKNNPIESADVDNCITFCVDCHKLAHKDKECTTSYLARC